jgi:hypothetical protein
MAARKVLTKARKRYISSLTKNLILVVIAAAFGGEYLFKLAGPRRIWFVGAVVVVVLTLFSIGVWLAVEGDAEET